MDYGFNTLSPTVLIMGNGLPILDPSCVCKTLRTLSRHRNHDLPIGLLPRRISLTANCLNTLTWQVHRTLCLWLLKEIEGTENKVTWHNCSATMLLQDGTSTALYYVSFYVRLSIIYQPNLVIYLKYECKT